MSKQKNKSKAEPPGKQQPTETTEKQAFVRSPWVGVAVVCLVTAVAFFPMLKNGLTNWDDEGYILGNQLIQGPDWRGIFTEPVLSNYHPLTMLTLAFNHLAGGLDPKGYHAVNLLLHLLNTGLVFWLAWLLGERRFWVATLTALFFGIHPMHVESVAWASERKDVLFTLFFLAAAIVYLRFLETGIRRKLHISLIFFVLSLLSKPAAVTFPAVLLLFDWYRGRSLRDRQVWLEKIPFFVLALGFAILTYLIQAKQAVDTESFYPFWQKICFAAFGFSEYVKRFFYPFPLSALHPFPQSGVVPTTFYFMFAATLGLLAMLWFFRKNKNVVFGLVFYALNVALVLQLLTFGYAVISERYTYIPYIGLAFGLAMTWAESKISDGLKNVLLVGFLAVGLFFAVKTHDRVPVWKDSVSLWTDVIKTYPRSHIARYNRAHYQSSKMNMVIEPMGDCDTALQVVPDHLLTLDLRSFLWLQQMRFPEAFADAEKLIKLDPQNARAYFVRGHAQAAMEKPDDAIADYSKAIELDPKNDEYFLNRGALYYNKKNDFHRAKNDFDAAIKLNPKRGLTYLNRARCWKMLGNMRETVNDAKIAEGLGMQIPETLLLTIEAK